MIQIDMEMPSSCYDCPFAKNKRTNDYGSFCECEILEDYETINLLEHSKHPNCPLVEQEPIVKEEYIPKSQYENRLKADMVAILEDLDLRLEEMENPYSTRVSGCSKDGWEHGVKNSRFLVQEKINALRGENNG